jgi:hypothetical protein
MPQQDDGDAQMLTGSGPASAGPPPQAKHADVVGSQLDAPLAGTSPQPGTEAHCEREISAHGLMVPVQLAAAPAFAFHEQPLCWLQAAWTKSAHGYPVPVQVVGCAEQLTWVGQVLKPLSAEQGVSVPTQAPPSSPAEQP